MADSEETPAQRQARIRREKREAKIKSGGQERLDKITQLSGRTPESIRNHGSPVSSTTPRSASPAVMPPALPSMETTDPEQLRQQEEFIRAMLRSQGTAQGETPGPARGEDPEDPMLKMLSSMLSGMNADPNAPNNGLPSLNPDDIAKATGLPPFLMNMMMGKEETPATPAELRDERLWKVLHVLFAFVAGVYMLFTFDKLIDTFGESPPAPATISNPFVIFVTLELLLHGLKPFLARQKSKGGFGFWLQTAKQIGRDGAVMVFLMGAYNWWHGLA